MAYTAHLIVEGRKYQLLTCEYEFDKPVNEYGKVCGRASEGGLIYIMIVSPDDGDLFFHDWMSNFGLNYDGRILFSKDAGEFPVSILNFECAYCVDIHESFSRSNRTDTQMLTQIILSTRKITFGKNESMKNVVAVTRGTGEEIEDVIKQKLEGIENSDNISHNDVHRFLQPKYPNEGFREMTNQWTGKLRERFDEADDFYRKVDYTNYDNHLRGIDFDKPVRVITEPQGNYVYQYCKIDNKGNPVIGDYFYRNQNIDVNLLGFDIGNRKMVRMKLTEPVEFLESTTSNIDDWFDSDKVFQGGEIQIFSPNTKNKVTEITIIK